MGIVFRQSIKSTIVIFTGNVLGVLFNYLGAHIFKDDMQAFGFSRTMYNIAIIGQIILSFGAGSVLQLLLQRYPEEDVRKKILIALCSLTPLVIAIILFPAYLFFRDDLVMLFNKPGDRAYFLQYYLWIAVLTISWSYITLYESYMLSQHKTAQSLLGREVLLRIGNIVVLALFYFKLISFKAFIIGSVLMYCLPVLVLVLLSMRTTGFGYSFKLGVFSRTEYKDIFRFAWSHLLVGISFMLIGYLDTLMLAAMDKDGLASVPVYIMAVFLVNIMVIPYRAMAGAVLPVLNQAYIDRKQETLQDAFGRSGLNLLLVTIFMLLVISLNLGNAIAILPKGYETLGSLCLVMALGRLVDAGTGLSSEVISISSHYRFNFRISVLLLVLLVVLDYLLIPEYGAMGAAWGVTAAQIIYNLGKVIFVRKKMKLTPFSAKTFVIVGCGIVTALLVYFIPFMVNPVVDALIRTIIIAVVYLGLLLLLRASPDINIYIDSVIKKKRLF